MLREIDERSSDSLRITLYWESDDNTLAVEVEDFENPTNDQMTTGIPPEDRIEAFTHPFAYKTPTRIKVAA